MSTNHSEYHLDPERVAKLPQWVQARLRTLEFQLKQTRKQLQAITDSATPSPFTTRCYDVVSGMHREHYLQADDVTVRHAGLEVRIYPTRPDDNQRDYGVEVTFSGTGSNSHGAAVRPKVGGFTIVSPETVEAEQAQRREWLEKATRAAEKRQAKGGAK